MPLSNGRPTRALPGPSIMPDRVLRAMHRASPNIYAGELIDMTPGIISGLQSVARTKAGVAMYIGNGHAAWEAALVNTLVPQDKVLVLVTGRFGFGWAEMAKGLGLDVEIMDFGGNAPVDPARLEARLREDTSHSIRAVLTVQTDTATSVNNEIPALRAAIDAAAHPALFQVDCIASFGCARFEMDAWGVDVMVTACQKGLMTPPGMSFVFVGDKALAQRQDLARVSPYFDWLPRLSPQMFYKHFCGTAPTHHLYGLREALAMIHEEGLEAVWARHHALAEMVWAAAEVWGEKGDLRLNIADRAARSVAVTTILTGADDAARLQKWTEAEAGLTLGIGLGLGGATSPASDGIFRIGHMGHVNLPTMMGTLGTIDAGLKALGIPHGGGALRVASEVAARHLAARACRD